MRLVLDAEAQDKHAPHPNTPAIPIAQTIAQGTAVAALDASSLIWTLESNEPEMENIHEIARE